MGGRSDSSRSTQSQSLATLGLGAPGAASLFGLPIGPARGGGLTITGTGGGFLPQVFFPEQFEPLGALAEPLPSVFERHPGLVRDTAALGGELALSSLGGIQELAETGFEDRIRDLTEFIFETDIAPAIHEQLGGLGLTGGDIDLQSALVREGRRSALEAANLATQNQILGLQAGLTAGPTAVAALGDIESGAQQAIHQGGPEGQLLNLFSTFAGIDTQPVALSFGGSSAHGSGGGLKSG